MEINAFLQDNIRSKSAEKADFLEVRLQETYQHSVEYQGEDLLRADASTDVGGFVRALVKGGVGIVSFNRLEDLPHKVEWAVQQAGIIGARTDDKTVLAPVDPVVDKVTSYLKEDPRKVSLTEKKELMENYNHIILSYGNPVSSSRITYFDKYIRMFYLNTEGSNIEQEKVDIGGNLVALATKNGNTQMFRVGLGGSQDFGVARGLEKQIRTACRKAADMIEVSPVRGGHYTVVLDPMLAGIFVHEAFGHLSESDHLYENEALQKIMKPGTKFGGRHLNIYDTGLIEGYRGSLKYDDEGVPTERTDLIREGELVGRLHTRETAAKMGETPTGNARALDYNFPPICRMRTTCIEAGETELQDMICDIDEGVYALDAYGGQTNGEMFTFKAGEAYMIRNGKVEEMVRDVNLTGNVFETLNHIDAVGNDFTIRDSGGGCGKGGQMPLPASEGAPSIRIKNVVVGGKTDG